MRNLTLAALALIGSALFVEEASAGLRKRGKRGGCGGGAVSHCAAAEAPCGGCAAPVAPACGGCGAVSVAPACGGCGVAMAGVPAGVTMSAPTTGVIVQTSGTEPMPSNVNQMPIVPAMYSTPATYENNQGRRGLFRR